MKKLPFVVILLALAVDAYSWDFSYLLSDDRRSELGVYYAVDPLGFYYGTAGFYYGTSGFWFSIHALGSNSGFKQFSLGYNFKITEWLRMPLAGTVYTDTGVVSLDAAKPGINTGLELDIPIAKNGYLQLKASMVNFNKVFLGVGITDNWYDNVPMLKPEPEPIRPTPVNPAPAKPAPRRQTPSDHPTITSEELNRVELAYAETVELIDQRRKHLYIQNMQMRNSFIQRYQGNPNTQAASKARNTKLEWFNIRRTSQEDIVAMAKHEPNDFIKVRMIHDWVADIFSYDYDLLWWMDNVSHQNAEFTLGAIIQRQRGVCLEYAVLFWFLLDNVGLDVYLISDHSKPGVGHAYTWSL